MSDERSRPARPPVVQDRRRHARVPLAATFTVLHDGQAVSAELIVQNLSVSGALVVGSHTVRVGQQVAGLLTLPGAKAVRVQGVVVRAAESHEEKFFALEFADLPREARQAIDWAVSLALEASRRATVLIVSRSAIDRSVLNVQLLAFRRVSWAVDGLIDVIRFLDEPNQIDVVFVGLDSPDGEGRDVLVYIAEEHPNLRRVMVAEREGAIAPATPPLAQAVLIRPWAVSALAAALEAKSG